MGDKTQRWENEKQCYVKQKSSIDKTSQKTAYRK